MTTMWPFNTGKTWITVGDHVKAFTQIARGQPADERVLADMRKRGWVDGDPLKITKAGERVLRID
jgi:hypothetical protein